MDSLPQGEKVTAIEAIRQSADLKTKGKDVKVSKLTYKMFGLEGLIAKKHFKRNRKKYRSTVVSLSLSIILFVSASAFSKTLVSGVDTGFETCDYQIEYIYYSTYTADGTADKAFPAELFTQLKSAEHVTGASMMRPYIGYAAVLTEDLSEDYRSVLKENAAENAEKLGTSADPLAEKYTQIQIWTAFLDDESYDLFLSENGLSRADVEKDGTTKPLYYGKTSVFDYNQEKFLTYPVYSEKKVPDFTVYYPEGTAEEQGTYFKKLAYDKNGNILGGEYVTYDSEIGEEGEPFVRNSGKTIDFPEAVRVKNLPFCLSGPVYSSLEGVFILPKSAENGYFNGYNGLYSSRQTMAFRSDDTPASMKDMKDIFDQNHLSSSALSDLEENERSARSTVIFVNVFAYGFIVLISLISVANVFNTITTNMNLRRREFAMLKTVGMTRKGFKKMMNFECILYGVKSLVYGLPVAVFFAFLINRSMNFGVSMVFTLPWEAIGISVFSVFTVVFVSMLFSMSKINKDNPIDALRNENL